MEEIKNWNSDLDNLEDIILDNKNILNGIISGGIIKNS